MHNATKAGSAALFAVADSRPDDYAALIGQFRQSHVRWQFVANAQEALRLARMERVGLWLINTRLPDMSGIELCSMIKNGGSGRAVCLVADAYDSEEERQARVHGASLFVCKPPSKVWAEFIALALSRVPRDEHSRPTKQVGEAVSARHLIE